MFYFEHTETTVATAAQLWRRYADAPTWPDWDHEVERAVLHGPFAAGTRGVLKPVGGPKTKFVIAELTERVSFTDVSSLPLATMTFAHRIEPTDVGSQFTHTVTISGPLSLLFGRIIGRKVAAGLPGAMRRLGALAEAA